MKIKSILFVTTILLPKLAWACAGGGFFDQKEVQIILNWGTFIFGLSSIIALIILGAVWALKKDTENKRPKWQMIFIPLLLIFNFAFIFLVDISFFIFTLILSALIILIVAVKSKKNEENKKIRSRIISASIILITSLVVYLFASLQVGMLCGSSHF